MRTRLNLCTDSQGNPIVLGTRHNVEVKGNLIYLTFPDCRALTVILDERDLDEFKGLLSYSPKEEASRRNATTEGRRSR